MKEYDFALMFRLNQSDANPEIYLDPLYQAGCDDALPGIGKPGYLSLDFIRESSSAFEAISSAIDNVKSVLSEAELIHISPDLVGIKELACIFKCSRQNIQKFVSKPTFPNPVYKGSQAIWHLAAVLDWFVANGHDVNQELLEIAELSMSINLRIGNQTAKPQALNQAKSLVVA
ncbi:MAG: DNA-binding protein [Xenococcus sp. MO_188.B8]|nr:DNA-binding protein [Xenococcus sp. MO_188.B8]